MFTYLRRYAALCFFIVLAGCANMAPQPPDALNAALDSAAKQAGQGQVEQAIAALQELGQRNPARAEPWIYIAKIRFDQKKYPLAIVAAEEALDRDPSDAETKMVLAQSAMRVATDSIAGLKGNSLLVATTRSRAQSLAQSLRDTYKDQDLFPTKAKPRRNAHPAAPKPLDPARNIGSATPAPVHGTDGAAVQAVANPFSSLMQ